MLPSVKLSLQKLCEVTLNQLPITVDMLDWCWEKATGSGGGPADVQLVTAAIVAFMFLLRCSQYCVTTKTQAKKALRHLCLGDVVFYDKNNNIIGHSELRTRGKEIAYVRLLLKFSKTDQRGIGAFLSSWRVSGTNICAVKRLAVHVMAAREAGRGDESPLFWGPDGKAMTAKSFNAGLRRLLTGFCFSDTSKPIDVSKYSSHSLRSGGATALFRARASGVMIKMLGRWASDCFMGYLGLTPDATRGASAMMVHGRSGNAK